jgi:intracellular sulfur oxidation DsrE/DsrF family protein
MNCGETHALLDAYADGELDLVSALRLESHLDGCAACRARQGDLAAVRRAVAGGATYAPAPARLRRAVTRQCRDQGAAGPRRAGPGWPAVAVAAALAVVALAALFLAPRPWAPAPERVVYHLNDSRDAATALRNLSNHLDASPRARIVVVAHNAGVEFLLDGAVDPEGRPFRTAVAELEARGVEFRACGNTLTRRGIDPLRLIAEARLVPSGVAEIARLQAREGFRYLKP